MRLAENRKDARETGPRVEEQRIVVVHLEDPCRIAHAVATMKGDLHSGKWKYLESVIDSIHKITERWAADEAVLGGGCHVDHRCEPCRSLPASFHARFAGPRMIAESMDRQDSLTGMAETTELSMRSDPVSGERHIECLRRRLRMPPPPVCRQR